MRNRGLKAVCEKCNNEWMGSIEEWAKPSLVPMINGTSAFLTYDSQRAIATWIAMKTMVAEFFDRSYVAIPLRERHFLKTNRLPPDNWKVWIGNYKRGAWAGQWAHTASGIASSIGLATRNPEIPNTQTTTLVIGQLYCHVFSARSLPWLMASSSGKPALPNSLRFGLSVRVSLFGRPLPSAMRTPRFSRRQFSRASRQRFRGSEEFRTGAPAELLMGEADAVQMVAWAA